VRRQRRHSHGSRRTHVGAMHVISHVTIANATLASGNVRPVNTLLLRRLPEQGHGRAGMWP
jgi:hypothetical protein